MTTQLSVYSSKTRCLRAGHRAVGARSVPQALQALSHGEIELIISDFKMPGMTGLELLAHLRDEAYDIPLIMVTGYASIEHAVHAIKRARRTT